MKKIISTLFLLFAISCPVLAQTNATISCASGPLRTTETWAPFTNTDDGMGRLQITTNCTVVPNIGATGYMNASFVSPVYTTQNPVSVSFTNGLIAVGNGNKAGWTFDLEVTLPNGTAKHFKMNIMSGAPAPNNQHEQSWPIVISLPAGTKFQAYLYAYADDVSWCSSTCYASAQWNLQ